jgi:hypothetical protein
MKQERSKAASGPAVFFEDDLRCIEIPYDDDDDDDTE